MSGKSVIRRGDGVSWKWGKGRAKGQVREKFEREIRRTIKGSKVTRKASEANPAFLIRQKSGALALKSRSEVTKG